jgi:hypothetical protein
VTTYRYLFADVRTGALGADVDLTGVSMSDPLGAVGSMRAVLNLRGEQAVAADFARKVLPFKGRFAVWAVRYGEDEAGAPMRTVPWAGQYASDDYDSTTGELAMSFVQLGAWLAQQEMTADLTYNAVDEYTIARGLLNHVLGQAQANVRLVVPVVTSGIVRTMTLTRADNPRIGDALDRLAGYDDGVYVQYDGRLRPDDSPEFAARFLRGDWAAVAATSSMWEHPGNVASYGVGDTQQEAWTQATHTADPASGQRLTSVRTSAPLIAAGYPRRVTTVAESGEFVTQAGLDARATATVADAGRLGPRAMVLVVRPDFDPVFGTYPVGSYCRVKIAKDARFPDGLDTTGRITQVDITPPSSSAAEQVTVSVDIPPTG